jgi:hypothetical protein
MQKKWLLIILIVSAWAVYAMIPDNKGTIKLRTADGKSDVTYRCPLDAGGDVDAMRADAAHVAVQRGLKSWAKEFAPQVARALKNQNSEEAVAELRRIDVEQKQSLRTMLNAISAEYGCDVQNW